MFDYHFVPALFYWFRTELGRNFQTVQLILLASLYRGDASATPLLGFGAPTANIMLMESCHRRVRTMARGTPGRN